MYTDQLMNETSENNYNPKTCFLCGAKSLGKYGGYESFINKLTEYHQHNPKIRYYVACKANGDGCMDPYSTDGVEIISDNEFIYHNAHCFRVAVSEKLGPAQAVFYDCDSVKKSISIIKKNDILEPIVYLMACRIGPFIKRYYKQIHKLGGKLYINPDGHEWMRSKWSVPVRKYWKLSEKIMVRYSDLVICDSVNIENYIHDCYDGKGIGGNDPKTVYIAYGAETRPSKLSDDDECFVSWLNRYDIKPKEYYLIVGRFVPENNYEIMIREFMRSDSSRNLVIVTNTNALFLSDLESKLHFKNDSRIKFVGTVYDEELLIKIRENAYGYLHGHEVGGTNPSLLEALGATNINLLLDVSFNREVAEDSALYWDKSEGDLSELINKAETFEADVIEKMGQRSKERIREMYSWEYITQRYLDVFSNE